MTRHLVSAMPEGAKIINMNSGKGYSAGQNSSSYHVSKAALKMFTEALANELWQQKIDVNTIIPGPTATTTLSQQDPRSGVTTEAILDKFTHEPPAGLPAWERLKHPDEVVDIGFAVGMLSHWRPHGTSFLTSQADHYNSDQKMLCTRDLVVRTICLCKALKLVIARKYLHNV